MNSVCVVVPIYKAVLDPIESIALQQCVKILGRHPITLLKPRRLDLRPLRVRYPQLREESLDDACLSSIRSYNTLMLSRSFYERFAAYEFILIHQLDAFVFRDELAAWCSQGFDYIGAPWLPEKVFASRWNFLRLRLKHWLQTHLSRGADDEFAQPDTALYFRVGNGGLSLRRVPAFLSAIDALAGRIGAALAHEPPMHEDIFFSIEANRGRTRLRIPDFRTAARFAVELSPRKTIAWLNGGALPFGCHAWEKVEPEFWREVMRPLGYGL